MILLQHRPAVISGRIPESSFTSRAHHRGSGPAQPPSSALSDGELRVSSLRSSGRSYAAIRARWLSTLPSQLHHKSISEYSTRPSPSETLSIFQCDNDDATTLALLSRQLKRMSIFSCGWKLGRLVHLIAPASTPQTAQLERVVVQDVLMAAFLSYKHKLSYFLPRRETTLSHCVAHAFAA